MAKRLVTPEMLEKIVGGTKNNQVPVKHIQQKNKQN